MLVHLKTNTETVHYWKVLAELFILLILQTRLSVWARHQAEHSGRFTSLTPPDTVLILTCISQLGELRFREACSLDFVRALESSRA